MLLKIEMGAEFYNFGSKCTSEIKLEVPLVYLNVRNVRRFLTIFVVYCTHWQEGHMNTCCSDRVIPIGRNTNTFVSACVCLYVA